MRRIRRISFGELAHDGELLGFRVRHGRPTDLAVHVEDIDDRPVREVADRCSGELLQRSILIGRDEQLGAKLREQALACFRMFPIGDVESRPDEPRRTSDTTNNFGLDYNTAEHSTPMDMGGLTFATPAGPRPMAPTALTGT